MNRNFIARELVQAAKDVVGRKYVPLNPDIYLDGLRKWRPEKDYLYEWIDGREDDIGIVVSEASYKGTYKLNQPGFYSVGIIDFMWEISEEMNTQRYWQKSDMKELLTYNSFVTEFRKIIMSKWGGQRATLYGHEIDDDFTYESSEGELDNDDLNGLDNAADKMYDGFRDSEFPVILSGVLKRNSFIVFIKKIGPSRDFSNYLKEADDDIVAAIEEEREEEGYDNSPGGPDDEYFDIDRRLRPY
jgi:hypothetical protein